jgi:hypothetical protein
VTIRLLIGLLVAILFMLVLRAVWLPVPHFLPASNARNLRSARPVAVLAVGLVVLIVALIAAVVLRILGVGDPALILNKFFTRGLGILVVSAVAAAWATKPSWAELLLGTAAGILLVVGFLLLVR